MLHMSQAMKGLTDIPGILVGHASDYDGLTGCTVILCEARRGGGRRYPGFATGTEEWDVLNPYACHRTRFTRWCSPAEARLASKPPAACGVIWSTKASVSRLGRGHSAIWFVRRFCYDLGIGKTSAHPTREMGESAAAAATDKAVVEGAVGAGTGATVGKTSGHEASHEVGHRVLDGDARGLNGVSRCRHLRR